MTAPQARWHALKQLLQPGALWQWAVCALPVWLVLIATGYVDPADGFAASEGRFWLYLPASALLVAGSMLLNWVKGFLVLHVAGVSCGWLESGRRLTRIHGLMALLEALSLSVLFLLRHQPLAEYLEQIQLFGHELLYAALLTWWLYEQGNISLKRSLTMGMLCFLASSTWLLLSVIAAL